MRRCRDLRLVARENEDFTLSGALGKTIRLSEHYTLTPLGEKVLSVDDSMQPHEAELMLYQLNSMELDILRRLSGPDERENYFVSAESVETLRSLRNRSLMQAKNVLSFLALMGRTIRVSDCTDLTPRGRAVLNAFLANQARQPEMGSRYWD